MTAGTAIGIHSSRGRGLRQVGVPARGPVVRGRRGTTTMCRLAYAVPV